MADEQLTKTVLELDLADYTRTAVVLEENLDVSAVKSFEDQIQSFIDRGLQSVNLDRSNVVFGKAGDNAVLIFDHPDLMHKFAVAVYQATVAHNALKTVEGAKRWFRMGAATGIVLLLESEKRIVGTTVARAFRLEAAAAKGELVVDLATYNGLSAELKDCYGAEESVSGKRDETFRVKRCRMIPSEEPIKTSTIKYSTKYRIAGRRQEIELFETLCADRMNYYGLWFYVPAGIGKSELIRQCCQIGKNMGYKIIGDKDKIVKESPALYFIRVCGYERERSQVLESTTIKSEIIAKLIKDLHNNTILVIDASEDFEDYKGLIDFTKSLIERLKSLDSRAFLLIATRMAPQHNPLHIYLQRLTGLRTTSEIEDFLKLKGMEELNPYARVLLEKTGGWPLILEIICSSP